ncbi:hypothetical protein E2C01_041625 [Portunus trituberculatus]|uniref:Uncharacterized protein n=1 Tax=Portunus trituberculatus TaxID=210409 RepID=A0A5B7FQU9_PORTR|nr:hypothetical protein [Portunus trituberculatus]
MQGKREGGNEQSLANLLHTERYKKEHEDHQTRHQTSIPPREKGIKSYDTCIMTRKEISINVLRRDAY